MCGRDLACVCVCVFLVHRVEVKGYTVFAKIHVFSYTCAPSVFCLLLKSRRGVGAVQHVPQQQGKAPTGAL